MPAKKPPVPVAPLGTIGYDPAPAPAPLPLLVEITLVRVSPDTSVPNVKVKALLGIVKATPKHFI